MNTAALDVLSRMRSLDLPWYETASLLHEDRKSQGLNPPAFL
jgi:hypothetical protein